MGTINFYPKCKECGGKTEIDFSTNKRVCLECGYTEKLKGGQTSS
jgi:ribosomal protein L37E